MISVGNGQLLLQRPVSQQMSAAHRPVFGIWLYFIKIHNLNTYDTLYTRHRQLLALTFSIISTESKYINYLVRAKRFFRDCIPGPRADHPAGNRCRKLTQTFQCFISQHSLYCTASYCTACQTRSNSSTPQV